MDAAWPNAAPAQHIDGEAVRSCVAPVSRATGRTVTTIEGLSPDLSHPLQRTWLEEDVPQCGYCQSGQLMSAAVLLREKPQPTDDDIDQAMTRQHLPLWILSAHPACHPPGGWHVAKEGAR